MIVIDVFGILMFIGILYFAIAVVMTVFVGTDCLLKWITRKVDMFMFKIKNYRSPYLARITNELSLKDEIEDINKALKAIRK